jgi:hypothetical protein
MELSRSRNKISDHEHYIGDLKTEISLLDENIKTLSKAIDTFNIPKEQLFDKTKLYQQNKIMNILGEKTPCRALLSYLQLREIFCLSATCKSAKAFIFNHPAFLRTVVENTYYDRVNLNTTVLKSYVEELRTEILVQEKPVITGVKRYLYYGYSVVELIENLLEDSMTKIDRLKVDLGSGSSPVKDRAASVMSFLKTALQLKEEKPIAKIKFNRIRRIPLELQDKISKLISGTPFEHFTLLDTSNKKIDIGNSKDYKVTQNKMFRDDIDKKSSEYMSEFNGLLSLMGNKT